MRELKFRTWDKKRKCYAKHIMTTNTSCPYHDRMNMFKGVMTFAKWVLRRYVFEQYTGLKDDNGKEIYEGDIVSVHDSDMLHDHKKFFGDNALVKCSLNKGGAFTIRNWYGEQILNWDIPLMFIEVIGNIHENPELLEEEE